MKREVTMASPGVEYHVQFIYCKPQNISLCFRALLFFLYGVRTTWSRAKRVLSLGKHLEAQLRSGTLKKFTLDT